MSKSGVSKLSRSLKELISAPAARSSSLPAPVKAKSLYDGIRTDAASRGVGTPSWLAFTAAATFTMNSPDSLIALYESAAAQHEGAKTAEFIREVGLKCISFNGIPRTINCLQRFRELLPNDVKYQLATTSTRVPTSENIDDISKRGKALWKSIYHPFDEKLIAKLSQSHPDLPVVILNSHYGALLSDPAGRNRLANVGRVLTSLVGIACLRAQTGTGPQVTSHLYGLRKAFEDGTFKNDPPEDAKGADFLATDEGSEWLLKSVDSIVATLGNVSSFAPSQPSKL